MAEYKLTMTAAEVNARLEAVPNKADLVNGQVPYAQTPRLTGYKTLYVDSSLGSDSNPGTESSPFKTIQAALDSLPKNLGGYGVRIQLAEGEYPEDVSIKGFYNRNEYNYLEIRGAADSSSGYVENNYRVKSIVVGQNASHVSLVGLWIYGKTAGDVGIELATQSVLVSYCTIKNESDALRGVRIGYYGHCLAKLKNVWIDGFSKDGGIGVGVDGGSVSAIHNSKLTNNTVGIAAAISVGGGLITLYNPTYEGNTTDTKTGYGGQIFVG